LAQSELDVLSESIKHVEDLLFLLVFLERENILRAAMDVFKKSAKRAEVYLALDGQKSATDLASELNMKRPNVSAEIGVLLTHGLIEPAERIAGGYVYRRRACFELVRLADAIRSSVGLSAGIRNNPESEYDSQTA